MVSKLIHLPKISDPRGNLTFIEGNNHIPFQIARVFWIYDVPGGETRGGHAYKTNQEFIIALSGSFDVVLDDGKQKTKHALNRSYYGLFVPAGTWRHMENFSTNSLALVIASYEYNENDYVRDYSSFLKLKTSKPKKTLRKIIESHKIKEQFKTTIKDCSLIKLNKIKNRAGNITPIEYFNDISFEVKRVFYLYDIPSGESRGAHAHKECHQFLIAVSGSFEVTLDDGENTFIVSLNRPDFGLHIPPGIWAAEQGFSSGSVCLVLVSHEYNENDYIRDYKDFILKKEFNNL